MLRMCYAAAVVLVCGGAFAADLELQPRERPAQTPSPAPSRLQSQEPPASAPADAAKPAQDDDKRMDSLGKPGGEAAPLDQSWWQQLVRSAPGCKSFSDGCRTCTAAFECSNIGIACQPKEWACNDGKR